MLPKVSFLKSNADEHNNGSVMLSRQGRISSGNYPIFNAADPIS